MTKRANLARHIPTSDAHAAEQATPAAVAAQTIAEPVPSVVGASGGLLAPGVSARVEGAPGQPLRAITLHRPWAYAIAHLGKRVENRTWPCPLAPGSLLAIHAGRKYDKQAADWIRQNFGFDCPPDGAEHPTGIVAIARFCGNVTASEYPWFVGPIGWQLADVVVIPPVPCSGQQGLWSVPADWLPSVRKAYRQAQTNQLVEQTP